jgi:hypothetical protein
MSIGTRLLLSGGASALSSSPRLTEWTTSGNASHAQAVALALISPLLNDY